jgi:mannosylglycerate synthase
VSLVVFPFKKERIEVVGRNLQTAAGHDRVDEVWAVAAAEDNAMADVARVAEDVARATGTPVEVFAQDRIGSLRSGKGDGMNTALARSAVKGFERTHFYDADITNFDIGWIDGAEEAADRGYGVVRHRFPRAATDAMITWMVTRPGLALRFPGTLLPRLGQPLGGEFLLSAPAVEALTGDPRVRARSDWGIDTVITHATACLDLGLFEHNAPDGKRHALYESLTDIRDMVLECLDAVRSLDGAPPERSSFDADPPSPVPADLKETVAYDVSKTRESIAEEVGPGEREILTSLDVDPDAPNEMDAERWRETLPALFEGFDLHDAAWRSAAFRLWVERVIHYTVHQVPLGYDSAISHLEASIEEFERAGSGE